MPSHVAGASNLRSLQDIGRSYDFVTSKFAFDTANASKNRHKRCSGNVGRHRCLPTTFQGGPARPTCQPRRPAWRPRRPSWRPGSTAKLNFFDASRGCPGASWPPSKGPRSMLVRFYMKFRGSGRPSGIHFPGAWLPFSILRLTRKMAHVARLAVPMLQGSCT